MAEEIKQETNNEIDELVKKAQVALDEFLKLDQEKIDYIVAKCSVAGLDHHGSLAKAAFDETGRGIFEDKATKNLFACEYVVNNMRHLKTVGVISEDPVTGITEIADPIGVICGITPVTNPTSTVLFKSLIALKTRNPIIFSFHPSAYKSSKMAAEVMLKAAVEAGAPANCIQWIEHMSMQATSDLMNHPGVATILATGGNAMVKAAYSCGKPALGVGAANVPAYVNKSANVEQAVNDIVISKSFDNGMICASEQSVIIDEDIYDEAVNLFKRFKVYFASAKEKELLNKYMFGVSKAENNLEEAKLNPDVVSPLEIEIKENKLKNKSQDEMDSEMLRDIEKTTIVKLSNKKSYKVSPIRKDKKKDEEVKEDKFAIETDKKEEKKGFKKSDEIEIL